MPDLFCFFENGADSPLLDLNLCLVAAGFKKNHVVLDGDDNADDSAGGDNSVASCDGITHLLGFALLLLLRTHDEEIEHYREEREGDDERKHLIKRADLLLCGACCSGVG